LKLSLQRVGSRKGTGSQEVVSVCTRPWSLKQAPLLVEMGRNMRGLLKTGEGDGRDLLQKLLLLTKRLAPLL
jgi:hypothetical protein